MESFEDKIRLNNELQKFQIEKSIVGTEAFYIEQDLEKGVSSEEVLENKELGIYKSEDLLKGGKRAVVGEIRTFGGKKYQKQANGWRPVKKDGQKSDEKKEVGKDIEEKQSSKKEVEHTHNLKESDKVRMAGGQFQRVVEINGNMVRLSGESDPVHISKLYRPDGSAVLSDKKTDSQSKHISDMSHEEKIQAAKKLGISNADTLSKKELNKQLIDKHVEKQLSEFKNK